MRRRRYYIPLAKWQRQRILAQQGLIKPTCQVKTELQIEFHGFSVIEIEKIMKG